MPENEVFTLQLPDEHRALSVQDAWYVASRVYKLAQAKLGELVATKLPPREDVLKAAEDAYDHYVKIVEDIGRDGFVASVGALYDGLLGIVKS